MKTPSESSRRSFIKKLATTSAVLATGSSVLAADNFSAPFTYLKRSSQFSANDNIQIALIDRKSVV